MNKKVSVIIPAYNCGEYISDALESALKQSYTNTEIIVVDDGSTDNTRAVIEPALSSNNIKYIRQDNKGPSAARNRGIAEASGRYVAFLDADDIWESRKIEESLRFMEVYCFDWICTGMLKIKKSGDAVVKRIPASSWVLGADGKELKQLKYGLYFFSSVAIHTPTITASRECFRKAGCFDDSITIGEDTDLWLRFEESGFRGGYLDEPLTIYRYNKNSVTRARKIDGLKEHRKVARKHAALMDWKSYICRRSYASFMWETAMSYLVHSRYIKSAKSILESLWYDPRLFIRAVLRSAGLMKTDLRDKRINVLYYDPTSGFGGSSRCLASWLARLDRNTFNPSVLAHHEGPAMSQMRAAGTPVMRIPLKPLFGYSRNRPLLLSYAALALNTLFFDLPVALAIAVLMVLYHTDILHINAKVSVGVPGIIAAKMLGVPCICHVHDTKTPVRREVWLARWIDRCIVLTNKALELYVKEYPRTKLSVIGNGIDPYVPESRINLNTARESLGIKPGGMVAGMAGRLVEGKGFDDFLKAARIVTENMDNVTFVIAGASPAETSEYEPYLKGLARELGIEKYVRFIGWRENISEVISAFDVLVQASSTFPEGFGMTVIEAMALKKPVIVTDIPGPSEIAVNGVTGLIVPPSCPEKLADALKSILKDTETAKEMGENGYKRVCEKYYINTTVRRIEGTYRSVVGLNI